MAVLLFVIFFGLIVFFIAQKKKHPSQPRIKSFLILLLPLVGVFAFGMFVVNIIDEIFHFNSSIFVNASVGALMMAFILAWRGSVARISRPAADANFSFGLKEKFHNLSKLDRQIFFGALVWSAGILIYTIGMDPFDNGSWEWMDNEEYSKLFFVMFVPPLFVGLSIKIYDKFFK